MAGGPSGSQSHQDAIASALLAGLAAAQQQQRQRHAPGLALHQVRSGGRCAASSAGCRAPRPLPARPHHPCLRLGPAASCRSCRRPNRRQARCRCCHCPQVLRPETLLPLLSDPEMLARLAPHLPEQHRSQEALMALAHSPQFQQQLQVGRCCARSPCAARCAPGPWPTRRRVATRAQVFGQALQTGQLDLAQFGLNARGFSVADFLDAIQELVEREQAQGQGQGGDKMDE
jgi:hypothetical protein